MGLFLADCPNWLLFSRIPVMYVFNTEGREEGERDGWYEKVGGGGVRK